LQPVSSVADDTFADSYARLRDRLQGPERFIAGQLGISGYLAVATVATRARPAGRLAMSPDQASDFVEAAAALGVHCCIGRVRLVSVPDAIPETRHAALFVTDDRPTAMSLVYFGITASIAAGAEQVELYGNHRLLGQLFGYPDCCAEFFVNSEAAGPDRLPASINSLGPFERLMNPISTYVYGAPSLLFHFPCSPACRPSITLLNQRIRLLSQIEPSILAIENLGAGLALYGPEVGVGLATEYQRQGTSTFRLYKILTRSQRTHELFGTRTEATIGFNTPRVFEINGRRFSRPDQFGALFV
jgi:hypothetical protein